MYIFYSRLIDVVDVFQRHKGDFLTDFNLVSHTNRFNLIQICNHIGSISINVNST